METEKFIELIEKAKGGDKNALHELYLDAYKNIFYLALKMVKNHADAEDITQEVCITIHEKISDLREPTAFFAWANQITVNKCNRFLGNYPGIARTDNEKDIFAIVDDNPMNLPDRAIDDEETRQIILKVIDDLPDSQRVCVLLFYYAEFTVSKIAETLEVNENTVKSRLSLARAKIRAALEVKEKKEGIKLWGIPIALTSIMRQAMEVQAMPDGIEARMWDNIQEVIFASSGAASAETVSSASNSAVKGAGKVLNNMTMSKALVALASVIGAGAVITAAIIFIPPLLSSPDSPNSGLTAETPLPGANGEVTNERISSDLTADDVARSIIFSFDEIDGIEMPDEYITITSPIHGDFGFDLLVDIPKEMLESARLDPEKSRLFHIDDDLNITEEMNAVKVNADGSATITISHFCPGYTFSHRPPTLRVFGAPSISIDATEYEYTPSIHTVKMTITASEITNQMLKDAATVVIGKAGAEHEDFSGVGWVQTERNGSTTIDAPRPSGGYEEFEVRLYSKFNDRSDDTLIMCIGFTVREIFGVSIGVEPGGN